MTARRHQPLAFNQQAQLAYAVVQEVAWRLQPKGYTLVVADPADPSFAGTRLDRLCGPDGREVVILVDPLHRAIPVWRVLDAPADEEEED